MFSLPALLSTLLLLLGIFLIFIILLQRGRGGGLAGAFGGLGGQSAFGTKAGDVFTKITIVLAVIWVLLAGVTSIVMSNASSGLYESNAPEQTGIGSADGEAGDGVGTDTDSTEPPTPGDVEAGSSTKADSEASSADESKKDESTDKPAGETSTDEADKKETPEATTPESDSTTESSDAGN